ncbi:hypothetical protein GCM10027190_31560 [Spirosoma areae]
MDLKRNREEQALGIREALIYKWKQWTKGEEKHLLSSQASNVAHENHRLLQRISQLEVERAILKKALSIVSQQT